MGKYSVDYVNKLVKRYIRLLNNKLIARKFKFLDSSCSLSRQADVIGASGITIFANCVISNHVTLRCADPYKPDLVTGLIEIGCNTIVHPYAFLDACGGFIKIGDYCSINPYTVLYGHGGLTIGNGVRIAAHTIIIPANHIFQRRDTYIHKQGLTKIGVCIKDDVWIGSGVSVLDGVTIETGCVIGAGSVVTRSTEAYGVYVGNPARRLRNRDG